MKALYEKAKSKNDTVIGIIGKDILTNTNRVVTYARPINANGMQIGVLFKESDLNKNIERHWIPKSFKASNLPFLEITYPQMQE